MTAKQLTDSILQLAIQGKLVPQDPNDEPASVLLERIREEKRRFVEEKVLKKKDLEEIPISEAEKLFEIPESWEWVRYKDIANCELGKTKNPNEPFVNLSPYLCAINVYWGRIDLSNLKEMPFSESEREKYCIKKGDMLICEGGEAGRSAIWTEDNKAVFYQNALHRVRFYANINAYLYMYQMYLYKTAGYLHDYIKGETIQHFVLGKLQSLPVPLPPLAEQHRIVQRIEEILPFVKEYGEAYEKASKMDAELPEKLKKSILQEAIKGKLGTQNSDDEPASVLLEQIREEKKRLVKEGVLKKKDLDETPVDEEEEPFKVPKSWMWVRFGDMVSTFTGKTPARGEMKYWAKYDYPWVSISDMQQGAVIDKTKESISQAASDECFRGQISKRGTLLMSFKLTVGRTSILGINAFHNEAIISINTFADADNYTRDYLAYILPIIANLGDSKDAIKGKTLNSKSIYNLFVPLPPYEEQHRIVQRIEELYAEIDNMTINKDINETEREETEE